MKVFLFASLVVASLAMAPSAVEHAKWTKFKAAHGKEYHPTEDMIRKSHFLATARIIESHNHRFQRGEESYEMAHNQFSDLSPQEFAARFLGKSNITVDVSHVPELQRPNLPSAPTSVDWRQRGIVTPVKNQGGCGSCYAFGTIGVVESAILQQTKRTVNLAEQQIVDCSNQGGCNGGHEINTMEYIKKNGLVETSQYPYVQRKQTCNIRGTPSYGKNLSYRKVSSHNEQAVVEALATYGTLVASVAAGNRGFSQYSRGILDSPQCTQSVDHLVSIVGYGTENGKDFFIVKNSWGSGWGENGYVRIVRGKNMCGIVSDHCYSISV